MLTRFPDWETRLGAFLRANAARRFVYGSWDCCLFVANAVREMTGADLAALFRGRYASRREAAGAMAEFCGAASVEQTAARIAAAHGLERIAERLAGRGDMVLVQRRRECSLGLIDLAGRLVIPFASELRSVDHSHAKSAWRI